MALSLVPDLPADPTPALAAPEGANPPDAEHPSRMLLQRDEDVFTTMDMDLRGGWTSRATPTLTHWQAEFTCVRHDGVDDTVLESFPVASLTMTVVYPHAGDPVTDLDLIDQDSGELAEALFEGTARTDGFADLCGDRSDPVLLIDTYEVTEDWRGTDLTPVLALRALKAFAHLGIRSAALCAAPISEDLGRAERDRIGAKIAAMWERAGFTRIATANHDGLDNIVMASTFDWFSIEDALDDLVGHDTILAVAADL